MIKSRPIRAMAALGSACVLLAAACGGSDDDSGASQTAAPPITEAPSTPDTTEPSTAPDSTTDVGVSAVPEETVPEGSDRPLTSMTEEEWDEVVAAAEEEGKVVLYSVMLPNQNERLAAAFSEAYPNIQLEVVRTLGDHQARIETERDTGTDGADVSAQVNYPGIISFAENDELLPLPLPAFEEEDWDARWLYDGYFFNAAFQVLGIGCNTQLIDKCPTSYLDLLDERYKDEIGIAEPGSAVVQDFWRFFDVQLGGTAGMEQFRDQNPVFYATAVPLQQGLAAGEVGVAGYVTAQLRADAEAGAPVEFIIPNPAWSPPIVAYAHSWSKRPNAALVLLNFMASRDGQTAIGVNGASALDGIDGTLAEVANLEPVDIYQPTTEWFEAANAEWREFFGR